MKNLILLLVILLLSIDTTKAQMSVATTFPGNHLSQIEVVNLSRSGKKYAVIDNGDTVYYYNLDYSFWKMIPCPTIPGYNCNLGFNADYTDAAYSSETLFNTDTFLEISVFYSQTGGAGVGKVLIINENGTIVDSLLNVWSGTPNKFVVHSITPTKFVATAISTSGPIVVDLPGTLPCDVCGGVPLGLAKAGDQPANMLSSPIPNPSKDQVKITFTLPEGATRGDLTIYNTDGKAMKSYIVDNRFGFIMVDNSEFAPGMYYYNLSVNGVISSTQKMVVIK